MAVIASYVQTRSNEGLPDDSDYVLVVRMEHTAHSKTCNSTKCMDVVAAPSGLSKAVFAGWPFLKSPCRPPLSRTRVFAANLVEKNHPILHKFLGIAATLCARNASAPGRSFDGFGTHVGETRMRCLVEIAIWRLESCAYLDVGVKQSGEGKERSVVRFAQPRGGRGCESLLRKIL
jgi:hypothetical protein